MFLLEKSIPEKRQTLGDQRTQSPASSAGPPREAGTDLKHKEKYESYAMVAGLPKVMKMKKTKIFILLSCILCILVWGENKLQASQSGALSLNSFLPHSVVSFDDLDPRDSNNQPITNSSDRKYLRDLFSSSVFSLLVETDIYTFAVTLAKLEKKLNLCMLSLVSGAARGLENTFNAIISLVRQLEKFIMLLTGFMAFSFLVVHLSLITYRLPLSLVYTTPLVLRC